MSLSLPSEFEAIVRRAVESGAFATPEDAVRHAFELLEEEQSAKGEVSNESREAKLRLLQHWVGEQKPAGHPVDDSRESIY